MKLKKNIALLLVSTIVVAIFSGCGKSNTVYKDIQLSDQVIAESEDEYVSKLLDLPSGLIGINYTCAYDDQLYFSASLGSEIKTRSLDTIEATYVEKMYKANINGTGVTELVNYKIPDIPEEKQGIISISSMCTDADGNIWVVEHGRYYHINDKGTYADDGNCLYLRKLDTTGAELYKADISSLTEEKVYFYINDMKIDNSGSIYILDGNTDISVFDSQGRQVFSLNSPTTMFSLVKLTDGDIAALMYDSNCVIKPIDFVEKNWGTAIHISSNVSSVFNITRAFSGSDKYEFYYCQGSSLFGYSNEEDASEKILNWIDCNINGDNVNSLTVLPDGAMICSFFNQTGEMVDPMLALLTKKAVTSDDIKPLKLACFGLDSTIRAAILNFNAENEQCRIYVTDYSEFNTDDNQSAGLTRLNTEIIAGDIPDLICTNGLPIKNYVAKGMLEDLYPYLNDDSALGGRDALFEEVLAALETEGSLYQISPGFMIVSVVAREDVVGSSAGWTLEELMELVGKHPEVTEVFPNMTCDQAVSFLSISMDEYVDWNTGKCYFNSDNFIKFLEFAKLISKLEIDWSKAESNVDILREGKALLDIVYINDFDDIQINKAMFDGDVSYIGYPCENKSGNAFYIYTGISMSSKCEYKESAWDFIHSLLTEDYQSGDHMWQFPTNKAAFEHFIEKAMEKDMVVNDNGEEVEIAKGFQLVPLYASTEEDVDSVIELISNTHRLMYYDKDIMNIVKDETKAYFNGQKSAEDVADIIQSRVSLYINE